MKVNCELNASNMTDFISNGKYTDGATQLVVMNADGYRDVHIQLKCFSGLKWNVLGDIIVNGQELEKAVQNALND